MGVYENIAIWPKEPVGFHYLWAQITFLWALFIPPKWNFAPLKVP